MQQYERLICPDCVVVADFGVGLEDIGLEDSDGNRQECVVALYRQYVSASTSLVSKSFTLVVHSRGFSWEKNYPGDEGISGDLPMHF